MEAFYALAADLVLIFHFGYLGFTVGGEAAVLLGALFGWGWIRNRLFRILHLAAVLVVALEALLGIWCPLTVWEYRLRGLAGQGGEEELPLVVRLVRSMMFYDLPAWVFLGLYLGFGALVLFTWRTIPPRRSSRPGRRSKRPPAG